MNAASPQNSLRFQLADRRRASKNMRSRTFSTRRATLALAAALFLAATATWRPAASLAASPIQVISVDLGDLSNPTDDRSIAASLRWSADDLPVQFVLHRTLSELVLLPINNPDEMTSNDVRSAIERAIEQWNDLPATDMEFQDFVRLSDFVIDERLPFGPDRARLDGYNLITFLNPDADFSEFDDGGFATTSIFYWTTDVDLSDGIDPILQPFLIGENQGDGTAIFDFSGQPTGGEIPDPDDPTQLPLALREYFAGEIIDADIIFDQSFPFRFIPEDEDDLTTEHPEFPDVSAILGFPDIQALATRELGYAMGGDSSLIPSSVMYSELASRFDEDGALLSPEQLQGRFIANPYVQRDLSQQLDARVLAAILYPPGSGRGKADRTAAGVGGISGSVHDGALTDSVGAGGGAESATNSTLELVPVYIGTRIENLPGSTRDRGVEALSDKGTILLQASVFTGVRPLVAATSQFDTIQSISNGSYQFLGLPAGQEYYLRLSNEIAGFSALHGSPNLRTSLFDTDGGIDISDTEAIPDDGLDAIADFDDTAVDDNGEWWGGAGVSVIATSANPSDESPGDLVVENSFWSVTPFRPITAPTQIAGDGSMLALLTNGETIISDNGWTLRVRPPGQPSFEISNDDVANVQFFEDDEADALTFFLPNLGGFVTLVRTAQVIDLDGDLIDDEVGIVWTFVNESAASVGIDFREVLEMTVARVDPAISVDARSYSVAEMSIGGAVQFETGSFAPPPARIDIFDNFSEPRIAASVRTDNPAVGSVPPTRFQVISIGDIVRQNQPYDYSPPPLVYRLDASLFTNSPAGALYWDGITIPALGLARVSYTLSLDQYERQPESGQPLSGAPETDPVFLLDDDPYGAEPVLVSAGGLRTDIDFLTNNGVTQLSPGETLDGGTTDPDDDLDPTNETPVFEDRSPANGGTAVPFDDFFVFGAVYGDVDNDGDLDVFVPISARGDDVGSGGALTNRLYINRLFDRSNTTGAITSNGIRRFDDVTFGGDGIPGSADDRIPFQPTDASYSASMADFDGDGDIDIFVCNWAGPGGTGTDSLPGRPNRFLENLNLDLDSDGVFETPGSGNFVNRPDLLPGIYNIGLDGIGEDEPFTSPATPAGITFIPAPFSNLAGPLFFNRFSIFQNEVPFNFNGDDFGIGHYDVTTSAAAGDINNDGLLDLVVGNRNTWFDLAGTTAVRTETLFGGFNVAVDEETGQVNLDERDAFPGENLTGNTLLFGSERTLINRGFDAGGNWLGFADETLGEDNLFGGGGGFGFLSNILGTKVEAALAGIEGQSSTVIFVDGFEDPIRSSSLWTFANTGAMDGWRFVQNSNCLMDMDFPLDPNDTALAFPAFSGLFNSMAYTSDFCVYATGSMGTSTSAPFNVPVGCSRMVISYANFIMNVDSPPEAMDPDPPQPFATNGDRYFVEIVDGSGGVTRVFEGDASQIEWLRNDIEIDGPDAAAFAGQAIRLRFGFESLGMATSGRGWYIDDVFVTARFPFGFDDRLPPQYPDYREDGLDDPFPEPEPAIFTYSNDTFELDASDTNDIALAPLGYLGGTWLDIYVANRREVGSTNGAGFRGRYAKRSGTNGVYVNYDLTTAQFGPVAGGRFSRPDGYFIYYNAGADFGVVDLQVDADNTDFLVDFPRRLYASPTVDANTGIRGSLLYNSRAMGLTARYADDPGGDNASKGTDGQRVDADPDYIAPRADHTIAAKIADFDYRGSWQVFSANVLDDGLNATILRPVINTGVTPPTMTRGGTIGFEGIIGGGGGAYNDPAVQYNNSQFFGTHTEPNHVFDTTGVPVLRGRPSSAAVGDFNLDGDIDILTSSDTFLEVGVNFVSTNLSPGGLQFFDNDSLATFTERSVEASIDLQAAAFTHLQSADLDNDGDLDYFAFTAGQGSGSTTTTSSRLRRIRRRRPTTSRSRTRRTCISIRSAERTSRSARTRAGHQPDHLRGLRGRQWRRLHRHGRRPRRLQHDQRRREQPLPERRQHPSRPRRPRLQAVLRGASDSGGHAALHVQHHGPDGRHPPGGLLRRRLRRHARGEPRHAHGTVPQRGRHRRG
jgi:hypothetical protein